MLSFDCCFCTWGSDGLVFVAPSALGPWAPQTDAALAAIHARTTAKSSLFLLDTSATASGTCNFTGSWAGVLGGGPLSPPNINLVHNTDNSVTVAGAVDTVGTYFPANASIVFSSFPGISPAPLVGIVGPFDSSTTDPCSALAWAAPYSPTNSFLCRYDVCGSGPVPPAKWTNEVNFCSNGQQPPVSVNDMSINPCSQNDVYGANFTVPAQQFNVNMLKNMSGGDDAIIYFGERFGSSPIGNKSADFLYLAPLTFASNGAIEVMARIDDFTIVL